MGYLDQFHHYILGTSTGGEPKPKLVFLHGLLGFSANWRSVARHFESDFEIFVFDQRGHGRSIQPEKGYAPEDYADDLIHLLDELGWKKINLVGHSMGGRNALNFASRFPDRVEKLVIEDIGPIGNPDAAEGYRRMFAVVPVPFASRAEALHFMRFEFAKVWPSGGDTLGMFLYSNLVENTQSGPDGQGGDKLGTVSWRISMSHMLESVLAGHAQDRWAEWESLKMPVLIVRGGNSRDLLPAVYEEMLRRNSHAGGEVVPGSGHWVHFEKPDAFVRILKDFLGDG